MKTIIGVMGAGYAAKAETCELAHELGEAIAKEGWALLCGGRDTGVMDAVAQGAAEAGGLTIGILPDQNLHRCSKHIQIPIVTGMGDARNVINVLSSHVVVALVGGAGTLSEVALAIKSHRPVILLVNAAWSEAVRQLNPSLIHIAHDIPDAIGQIKRILANSHPVA